MFEDQAGNLWFGTDGEGAHMYDGKSFTSYTQKDGLAGNVVRCILGDRHGRIWIGTNGDGVSCYDGTTFRNFTKKDGLNNDRIYELLEDKAGNMWFSTLGAGACRYDGKSFTAFREDHGLMINDRPARGHVQEMFEDKDGIIWFGCSGGLFRFDGKTFINVTRNGPWPTPPSPTNEHLAIADAPMRPGPAVATPVPSTDGCGGIPYTAGVREYAARPNGCVQAPGPCNTVHPGRMTWRITSEEIIS